jgi:1-acyl-sn-glycerol-3-phosphate acyltransferase
MIATRLYRSVHWIVRQFTQWFFHLHSSGQDRIPVTGGLILASNHASHLDPQLIAVSLTSRPIHFMARHTLFRPAWFGRLLSGLNAHPITRGQGMDQDWDVFVRLLTGGAALLVFPEGTRTRNGELQHGKLGFGRLAALSKVPVYPVYVEGTYAAWPKGGSIHRHPVSVHFGSVLSLDDLHQLPDDKHTWRLYSERVMQAITMIRDQVNQSDRNKH